MVALGAVGGVQPPLASEEGAGDVGRRTRLAERGAAGAAVRAAPARRDEGEDDMVARGEPADALAGLEHLAGGLVTEHHRHHPRARAVDHREVGVAEARRAHLDQ